MNWTDQKINEYRSLHNEFNKRCEEICNILTEIDDQYKYIDTFFIEDNYVACEGENYHIYKKPDHYYKEFPLIYLYMDNDDIVKHAIGEKKKVEDERSRFQEQQRLFQEMLDKYEYERLKEKYGL